MESSSQWRSSIKCLSAVALAAGVVSAAWGHPPGRMTGGGSLFCPVVERVTHGFELHCGTGSNPEGSNPPVPNNWRSTSPKETTFT